jgi:pyruvate formate lyase activating enzyme
MVLKGIIFDIKKFAIHDGPGIRTTVFMKGCPLDCWWCHNPESRSLEIETIDITRNTSNGAKKKKESVGKMVTSDYVIEQFEKDRIFYDNSDGGVTFSGGEPMLQIEFLTELLIKSKQSGFHTTVDTSGHAPWEDFEKIVKYTDLFLYDLKLMNDDDHVKYTGVSNKTINSNLQKLINIGSKIIVRIPMIPDITDTDANLTETAEFINGHKEIDTVCLLQYNKFGEDKMNRFDIPYRMKKLQTQDKIELDEKASIFRSRGFEVLIGG